MDRSLINVSDGPCLPWISGDLNSKLLEKTAVSENASESKKVSKGHKSEVLCPILDDRFGANFM